MVSMGEMLDNIAHQWRQPLSVITSLASGMKIQQKLGLLDVEKDIETTSDKIMESAQYLSQTIEDFRGFLRKDKEMTTFALNPVIQRSLKIIEGTFNSVTINLDCPKEIIVNGYQNELIQAILNILNNARDILIEKQIENKLIDIQVTQDEQYAIIQISDNAGGIPDEFLDKIFNSDFTTKGEKGTGIGLYMTNQIITNMNGKINVSNNAQGAVFNILLPLEMVNS